MSLKDLRREQQEATNFLNQVERAARDALKINETLGVWRIPMVHKHATSGNWDELDTVVVGPIDGDEQTLRPAMWFLTVFVRGGSPEVEFEDPNNGNMHSSTGGSFDSALTSVRGHLGVLAVYRW